VQPKLDGIGSLCFSRSRQQAAGSRQQAAVSVDQREEHSDAHEQNAEDTVQNALTACVAREALK
jgi:uncharacterized membrane protein